MEADCLAPSSIMQSSFLSRRLWRHLFCFGDAAGQTFQAHAIFPSIICWCLWDPAKVMERTLGTSQEHGSLVVASDPGPGLTATLILKEGVLSQGLP